MLPATLEEALAAGTKLYFDVTECSNGHIAPRRWGVSVIKGEKRITTKCEECRRANRAKHRPNDIASHRRNVINGLIRSRLQKRARRPKQSVAEKHLGCSIEFYMYYLEHQWFGDMSWANWGTTWEIDHIKECYTFDLSDPDQHQRCFHYTNTRPLPKTANTWTGAYCAKNDL